MYGRHEVSFETWGVAIDANLEAEDEGRSAGIYIMFTIIAAVIVVGISPLSLTGLLP
ncbi:MAG: hypothetical protein CM1200mP3_03700 [Chloroflexota bacterium]|nr:MAG: hypothetical protein CM1200mP3_03700 [Chloroflexota bacterium]